ncbi:uncharacterized protein LOC134184625 [Corticium candelabrum]|uniref:uncharacterized protein LOC134184625 n=1 Tax=Corticium candelabrum TaxID=121492 RepID=UPI002E2F7916|nr:uncharacterized protein LOC134184625 [Corticium candelabrum]
MSSTFFSSCESCRWKAVLKQYERVLETKAEKSRKRQEMVYLDNWFQKELPSIILQRDPKHVTRDELIRLMEWKLTRGKFRPRLSQLVKENSEELVVEVSTNALKKAAVDLKAAIIDLTRLKAVGPATASAVLCAGAPDVAPFLADESAAAVSGLNKVEYTLPYYLEYAKTVCDKAEDLKKQDPEYGWNAHKVELSLWTFKTANQLGFDIKEQEGTTEDRRKRKHTDDRSPKAAKRKVVCPNLETDT